MLTRICLVIISAPTSAHDTMVQDADDLKVHHPLETQVAKDDQNLDIREARIEIVRAWAPWVAAPPVTTPKLDHHVVTVEDVQNLDRQPVALDEAACLVFQEDQGAVAQKWGRKVAQAVTANQIRDRVAVVLNVIDANTVPEPNPGSNVTSRIMIDPFTARSHRATTSRTEKIGEQFTLRALLKLETEFHEGCLKSPAFLASAGY